ncbi:uncharacterized protein [Anabrus simplex]|uniref:uncharacterized protein n=1 Tax=Anabrus simplex TaxID=316456 RepID=UPI0035A2914E
MDTAVGPVCCPVCTLFMREGISLESHLNTHPKDQVIEALVRYCITSPGIAENNSSTTESIPTSQDNSSQHHDQSVLECTPAQIPTTQYPTFGSSHFTAAITYQQFLSSNATPTGAVIPQYVSVPTILATPNPAHADASQPAIMPVLYNPYLMQQQQQQVQFYNSVRTQPAQPPLLRQILPAPVPNPPPMFPVPQHMSLASSCAPVNNCSMSSTSTVLQVSQNTQTNISSSTSSVLHVAQVGSPVSENVSCSPVAQEQNSNINPKDACLSSPKSPVSDVPVHSNEQQHAVNVATSISSDQVLGDSQDSLAVPIDDNVDSSVISRAQTTSDKYKQLSTYLKDEESTTVTENGHSLESLDKEENKDEVQEVSSIYSPENPEMRVREDLSDANVDLSVQSDSECVSSSIEHQTGSDDHSPEANSETNMEANDDLYISDVIKNGDEAAGLSDIMGVSFVIPLYEETDDHTEYITSDCYHEEFNEVSNQQVQSTIQVLDSQKSGGNNLNNDETTTNEAVDFDSSQQVNVIEIDGMHFFVPSQFLENSTGGMDRKVTVIQSVASLPPNTPTSSSTTSSASCKMETSQTLVNLDMQTDELMPPRGELSEQESVGGNDSSMWANNFHDKDEDVSTSYDLLARESWEASDGSDVEGPDNNPPAESTMSNQSPEPVIPPVVEKKKEKITPVYKCWWCGESFNCPKERRVHQSTKHGRVGLGNNTNAKSKSKLSQVIEGKQKSNIKEESQEQNTPSVQSEPAQFARVFVRAHETLAEAAQDKEKDFSSETKVENEENDNRSVLRYSCSRCDANFVSVKCLQRHIRTVHKDHKFKHRCGTCKETFSSDSLYHAHLKVHPLECIRCGKYFYRRQNLNLHIKRHLGIKPYKCAICDKAFVTKQKLAEHTNCHTGNSPLKCSLCSETFRRYSNLIQHKNRYHLKLKKKIKDFICTCGEVFHSKKKLEWHKEIHDEKPKSCTFCSERFVHAASLTRHVRHAHDRRYVPKSGRENENVECPVCSCVYLKSSLQVHMRVHSGERPYPCHICAKGFTTKWNLQLHRWTHASRSSKPFKCSLCKSAFFRRTDYTSHMHSHRNERPYTCNYCGCQFIRKYNCLRHVREHEKVKSFTCNVCNKTFHRSYYLQEHMRIHSGVRPFACHICGKASSTKSNHNKHVKIHHAREPVNTEG